ncbi:MAG TPA: helix-turn-helix transcriptional regulator [Candidatus Elarobacter sp.]|jgi:transcriptional regulator with XRE-family HTH domain
MTAVATARPVGELLRGWREQRRLSQLELAGAAEISTRHLSFVETNRARPSREMVVRLSEQLDVPLRERNLLLLAAGYAPLYAERAIDAPHLAAAREAVRTILRAHEPYPAVVIDRRWNLVDANESAGVFTAGIDPELLGPPLNVMRVSLHPRGLAPRIVNLAEWRAHLLDRLRRDVAHTADPGLAALLDEIRAYPCDAPLSERDPAAPPEFAVPLRIRHDGRELSFVSVVATFGTPLDVTVAELSIESFFPADEATGASLRRHA